MCTKPILVKKPRTKIFQYVPCGHCMECRLQLKQALINRCLLESLNDWKYSYFITLTYNDENVPRTNCGKPVIVREDFVNFKRRLKNYLKSDIAYMYCAEYGDEFLRCHFHLILFINVPLDNKIISKIWNKGFTYLGSVTNASISYVASYITSKSSFNPKDVKTFKCPQSFANEFSRCSNLLGFKFVENHLPYFLSNHFKVNGKTVPFPRYFIKKFPELKIYSVLSSIRHDNHCFNDYDLQVIRNRVNKLENYDFYNSSNKEVFKNVN